MATELEILKQKAEQAKAAKDSAYSDMVSWCNVVSSRNYTEGTNKTTCSKKISFVCGDSIEALCCYSTKYADKTCESNKNTYNAKVLFYDTKVDEYETAKEDYENAGGDANDLKSTALEEEAGNIRVKYIVFGFIVLALIGVGLFLAFRKK